MMVVIINRRQTRGIRLLSSVQLLVLLLHYQLQICHCAGGGGGGLRGKVVGRGGGEQDSSSQSWPTVPRIRTSLVEDKASPGGTLLVQPLSALSSSATVKDVVVVDKVYGVAAAREEGTKPPLMCPFEPPVLSYTSNSLTTGNNNPCGASASSSGGSGVNKTTAVCQYDSITNQYTTLCLQQKTLSSSSSMVALPNAHPKSYCGVCRACFQTRDELKAAIKRYKSYKRVDTELATKYGWPIGDWCVDNVTSFSNLFFKKSKFNEDLSNWSTSQVTDMTSVFQNAYDFNQPLKDWDVSRVTSMTRMFAMALHFNQDVSNWDVSKVKDMGYMFLHALEFEGENISNWDVQSASNLNSMFFGANSFKQEELEKWQISSHADTENMCEWTQQTQEAEQQQQQ